MINSGDCEFVTPTTGDAGTGSHVVIGVALAKGGEAAG
jgi:hypothetical protein